MNIQTTWNHSVPPSSLQQYDLQLMTICGVSVLGRWEGEFGEFYVGWAPLLGAQLSQLHGYKTSIPEHELYMTKEEANYVN